MECIANRWRKVFAAALAACALACAVLLAAPPQALAACDDPNDPEFGGTGSGKPAIVSIGYSRSDGSGPAQPAAGGKFVWLVTFAEGSDLSKVEDDDFTIQRKPWKKDWRNSKCPVPFFEKVSANVGRFTATAIPDNKAGQNLWRFLYLGQDVKCPIIVQYAYEGKTELLKAIDAAEKNLAGTAISADGADLAEGAVYATQQAADAFQKAIDDAQAVCDDESITQDVTDAAVATLNDAVGAFDAAKKTAGAAKSSGKGTPAASPGKGAPAASSGKGAAAASSGKADAFDGTALGAGASAKVAEDAIRASASKEGPAGSLFGKLQLRSTKQAKSSITLKWAKVKGAKSYVVYAGPEGKKGMKKAKALAKTSCALKKIAGKKLAAGRYYRALVVALDARGKVVSSSKVVHVATKGGKAGNPSAVSTKAKKGKLALKAGKTFKLSAKQKAPKGAKVAKQRAVKYETSNAKVATVNASGVVRAKAKGTCYVYAYAQNGIFAKVKVTVKSGKLKAAAAGPLAAGAAA